MNDVLEFDGIELHYDTRKILSGIYMKCAAGEVIGILGRNGCGKSSLLKVVFGSVKVNQRSVRINEQYLGDNYMHQRRIAYLPQDALIPANISIQTALRLFGVAPAEIVRYFPEVERFLPMKPGQLSGGYRRIIETMLVLKSKATFCLLDEPFSGIMPVHVETLRHVLADAKATKGIIITDHLYREVLSAADRLYLLTDGRTFPVKDQQDLVARGYISTL